MDELFNLSNVWNMGLGVWLVINYVFWFINECGI